MRRGPSSGVASALAGLLASAALAGPPADGEWLRAEPGFRWSFARDHYTHPDYRTEWWYFTGHLESTAEPGRRFGFQFTLFRVGLVRGTRGDASAWAARDLLMGHAALGDPDRGEHRFSEVLYRATPFLAGFGSPPETGSRGLVAWSRGPLGTDEDWQLAWNGDGFAFRAEDRRQGFAFSLTTRATKPLVLQGPAGYSRKADEPGRASLYYSLTRLATEGIVTVDGETIAVRGTSWMDKEFGSHPLAESQSGWDWFCIQLDDGRELMLYLMRDREGRPDFGHGTLVDRDGTPRYLAPEDWSVEATGRWRSPETGAEYPSGWRVALPDAGLELRLEPTFAAQENVARRVALAYWEGAVEVRDAAGARIGQAYVELTGYGSHNRPGL